MRKIIANIPFYGIVILLVLVLLCQTGILPFRFMYVRSGSMVPTFYPGDLAVVSVIENSPVHAGDVIFFKILGEPVLHRAISIENGLITTQGDANNTPDLQKVSKVNGKFLFAIPKLGYPIAFIQTGFITIAHWFHAS
ncbi:MAG TPA: signal peptidase I [Anaerolineaceae bacterium]|jgi:signal peptidase I